MEPDSYIRPHRHLEEGKEETLVVVQGRMGLVLFDDGGQIRQTVPMGPAEDALLVHIPCGTYHTWISLQGGSVFFEAKAGPYRPLGPQETASWAPAEGDPTAAPYLAALRRLFVSEAS
jgi:cupin fold WbuC family metalloprotein